jgi:rSAM/selenodomain-associated transferase 2
MRDRESGSGTPSVATSSDCLSVIIPTLNASRTLAATLGSLSDVGEIIIADGGSTDDTINLAMAHGARVVRGDLGRGRQLIAGAACARGDWFLFLHADTVLEAGWRDELCEFQGNPQSLRRAAAFRFALDDTCAQARRLERLVAWRVRSLGLAYGDLVIHREFYSSLGGYQPWPLMEDVDLVWRIGRHRLMVFRTAARTSAERWRRDGWHQRSLRNFGCLALYALGVPPPVIRRLYD